MKIRIKLGHAPQPQMRNKHSVLDHHLEIAKKPLPTVARSFRLESIVQGTPQQRLVEIEAARNRALGQAYLSQLPPR